MKVCECGAARLHATNGEAGRRFAGAHLDRPNLQDGFVCIELVLHILADVKNVRFACLVIQKPQHIGRLEWLTNHHASPSSGSSEILQSAYRLESRLPYFGFESVERGGDNDSECHKRAVAPGRRERLDGAAAVDWNVLGINGLLSWYLRRRRDRRACLEMPGILASLESQLHAKRPDITSPEDDDSPSSTSEHSPSAEPEKPASPALQNPCEAQRALRGDRPSATKRFWRILAGLVRSYFKRAKMQPTQS